ncbi:YHYH protein [Blastopirellula sp. JC732]|uniref:YHYH protein n=1 Tax=Blastopirellula sediminis TaxID=2894196 RepID=A0A9X1MNV3_9BACT|nr:YHYH protein [Blastopirellula sediminis]MCC9606486.1 YHYH protein [Blastopirellula sediminis]MCC9630216.1 YHYH protein [Blastopirellula sediminis]
MFRKHFLTLLPLLSLMLVAGLALAQFGPQMRRHMANQMRQLQLVPATQQPPQQSRVQIEFVGNSRVITANGMPEHKVGQFPNRGNPNPITEQRYVYRVPAQPMAAVRTTPLGMQNFGICLNGVPFDPGAAEWYQGNPNGGWQYEALSGAVPLGIDANHAHVQPTGAYHYHGLPSGFLKDLNVNRSSHSPIIGWAADGFPIYALYGYKDPKDASSEIVELDSSYQLKTGTRPGGSRGPGGTYDGTFLADYQFVSDKGDLDECNGRFCVTPDFPEGTYAYFLTQHWPVIPRAYRGTPSSDFARGPGRNQNGRGENGPPGRGPGGFPPPRR